MHNDMNNNSVPANIFILPQNEIEGYITRKNKLFCD
jgi:hypothetical protein